MKNKSLIFKGAVALLAGYILYKMFSRSPALQEGTTQSIPKPKPVATLDMTTIQQIVKKIVEAISGLGTDEAVIFAQFRKLKNNEDFLELNRVFGTRVIPSGYYLGEQKGDLRTLLRYELSDEDILQLNRLLESKGIKSRI
jgi:hypothetical protein